MAASAAEAAETRSVTLSDLKTYLASVQSSIYIPPWRYSAAVQVLLVSEFSASTQQLFLPDKQPATNQSAAFREGDGG